MYTIGGHCTVHTMSSSSPDPHEALSVQDEGGSQAVKAQQRLRELILQGELAAGTRITELMLVELLGVSRTPIRSAMMRLEQEGLLEALPAGGHAVRIFSEQDVADAIELRGTLEGLAARLAAERAAPAGVLAQARACLDQIDQVLLDPSLSDEMFSAYVRLNARFHRLLSDMSASPVLQREIERAGSLPFASPSGFVGVHSHNAAARDMLVVAQHQHRQVLEAIATREGARAQALMQEHSRIARLNMQLALREPGALRMPGAKLIRPEPLEAKHVH
jgi:GntR family transcriptional regulator, vanillate catabolism transcriptional regulator